MSTVNIAVVIDVETAIAHASNGIITTGLYMIDSTGYLGTSSGEATNELSTTVNTGDSLVWTPYPVDPNSNVLISAVTGNATTGTTQVFQKISTTNQTPAGQAYASCIINEGASVGATTQYSLSLNLSGTTYTYDPFVYVAS
jgi:hypothetical protein